MKAATVCMRCLLRRLAGRSDVRWGGRLVGGALAVLVLVGCGKADERELRDWLAEQHRQLGSGMAAASAPPALPVGYARPAGRDPFDVQRLSGGQAVSPASVPARPGFPLEVHPLSSLRMVGSLRQGEEVVALIQADVQIYQVPVGASLGASRAKVLRISEAGVVMREIVRGPEGQAVARTVTLPLQGR